MTHTHSRHNLRLQPELVLESASKIAHSALVIRHDVRYFADMIEHVPACEQQDCNEADCGPTVAVLDHRQDIRRRDREKRDQSQDGGDDEGDLEVVDWTDERWMWNVGELAG